MKTIKASLIALSLAPLLANAGPVFNGVTLDNQSHDEWVKADTQIDKSAVAAPVFKDNSNSKNSVAEINVKNNNSGNNTALDNDTDILQQELSKLEIPKEPGIVAQAHNEAYEKQRSIAQLLGLNIDGQPKTKEELKRDLNELDKVLKHASPLPVKTLLAIEANGKMLFISDNQRFIFEGKLYDMYNSMKELKSVADIEKYALKNQL